MSELDEASVLRCDQVVEGRIAAALADYGLEIEWVAAGEAISGSWFGDSEAGLIGNRLYLRPDTPLHSALHEACHYICMDSERRGELHTNAGGGYDEENGVCYLQILLADRFPEMGRERMLRDMDAWGYSFRLGSAAGWFYEDAEDALEWLNRFGLLDGQGVPNGKLRP